MPISLELMAFVKLLDSLAGVTSGYQDDATTDGTGCTDIDACTDGTAACHDQSTCANNDDGNCG